MNRDKFSLGAFGSVKHEQTFYINLHIKSNCSELKSIASRVDLFVFFFCSNHKNVLWLLIAMLKYVRFVTSKSRKLGSD